MSKALATLPDFRSHLIRGTIGSTKLCERIAALSKGVCLLGFSRGKDSICAWMWLRRFFHTIVPFHCVSVPHLSFVDRSLAYYEKVFGTKIERCMSGDTPFMMKQLVFQPGGDEKTFEDMEKARPGSWSKYGNGEVATVLKEKLGLCPQTYTAYGISAYDSMFRRLRMTEKGTRKLKEDAGYRASTLTFFPCYDWSPAKIIRTIELCSIRLPDDYLLANRTIANMIDYKHLVRLRRLFPEDFKRVKAMFPFIEAYIARQEFRKRRGVRDG